MDKIYIKDLENESLARLLEVLDERDKNILIDNINKQEIKSAYFELNNKDLMSIKSIFRLIGISDIIILKNENLNTVIKDILEDNLLNDSEDKINSRAIIFNNIESRKISSVSDNLKRLKIQRPLLATVTETSVNWDLKNLLCNLQEEAISLNTSKISIHKK